VKTGSVRSGSGLDRARLVFPIFAQTTSGVGPVALWFPFRPVVSPEVLSFKNGKYCMTQWSNRIKRGGSDNAARRHPKGKKAAPVVRERIAEPRPDFGVVTDEIGSWSDDGKRWRMNPTGAFRNPRAIHP
jgi:hypothetical protein